MNTEQAHALVAFVSPTERQWRYGLMPKEIQIAEGRPK